MSIRDFLHKNAETPLCVRYMAAGAICSFATNSEDLLAVAHDTFLPVDPLVAIEDFSIRFWVDDAHPAQPPWPKPYVRGLDHLVFAGFDPRSSLLADLRARRVIGRFSAGMVADTSYWKTVIFPMLLSVLAGSVGLVEQHASCVARDRRGLVLIGPTGSGKSTLAMALTEVGFRFVADDRIFCSFKQGKLAAWGMPRPLKLRREAAAWFEELRDREPGIFQNGVQNGEPVFHCDPNQQFGREGLREGLRECEPRVLVFLDRQEIPGFSMTPMDRGDARSRIEVDLMAEAPEAVEAQSETIEKLLALPCWHLKYGGRPQAIAENLTRHV
jgi:gluconate kinase